MLDQVVADGTVERPDQVQDIARPPPTCPVTPQQGDGGLNPQPLTAEIAGGPQDVGVGRRPAQLGEGVLHRLRVADVVGEVLVLG